MRIAWKLLLATCVVPVLIWAMGIRIAEIAEENLLDSIRTAASVEVRSVREEIDRLITNRTANWRAYSRNSLVNETLLESNARYDAMLDPAGYILEQDRIWAANETAAAKKLANELMGNRLSRDLQATLEVLNEVSGYPVFGEVFVTNAYGANVAQSGLTSDFRQDDEEWWQGAASDGIYIGDAGFDESAGIFSIEICPRIDDAEGNMLGVMKAVMNIRNVVDIVDSHAAHLEPDTLLVLLTADGGIIRIGNTYTEPLADGSRFLKGLKRGEIAPVATAFGFDRTTGTKRLSAYATSDPGSDADSLGWIVVQQFDAETILAPIDHMKRQIVIVSLAAALAGLLILLWIALPLGRRIGRLNEATDAVARGEWQTRIETTGNDEITKLSERFNLMTQQLSKAAKDLTVAKERAEEASEAKSEFLANMSHEIRTPMNGIVGMTDLLFGTGLNKEQREYLHLISLSADSLLTVINDILDFSKIEAGKMQLDLHEFDLRDSIGDTLQTLGHRAEQKGLELAYQVRPEVPDCLLGDLGRIRQVLVNLTGNAIKFTEQGEVVVDVRLESQTRDQVSLHFLVKDTGIGIHPDKQQAIFESFSQAESSTTRTHGGTGLGLAISRKLVELMKGRLWLESQPGEGSTFHFTALLELGSAEQRDLPIPPETLNNLPVLVVDDNATNRKILQEMLLSWEMAPEVVSSGAAGLDMLAAATESGTPFQLILLDAMMPEMDGLEVAGRIQEQYGEHAPGILILSSAGQHIHADERSRLGIERALCKPLKQSDLLDAITRLFGSSTRDEKGARSVTPMRPGELRPMRVLLAEDGRVNQMVAIKLLEDRGHSVTVADDGQFALEALQKESFDAILMDVQMPRLDGYAATRIIREKERESGEHIPIVAMTANAMKGDREKCLESGMDDYVAKPVRSRELLSVLEKYAPESSDGTAGEAGGRNEQSHVFDPKHFREGLANPDLMREVIDLFPEETRACLEQARQAASAQDRAGLQAAAHSLRGIISNYSAKEALLAATKLDKLADDGDLIEAARTLADCEREVEQLRDALLEFRQTLT